MANNNTATKNSGVHTIPQVYSSYDILHNSLQKTLNGESLRSGIYLAKVLNVRRHLDPQSKYYYDVLVWIPDIDKSHTPPELYTVPKLSNYVGLDYFYPQSRDTEEPCVGMEVNVFMIDPVNRIGFYVGPLNNRMELIHIVGQQLPEESSFISSPSDAFNRSKQQQPQQEEMSLIPQEIPPEMSLVSTEEMSSVEGNQ